jgi:GDP-4-dehydro-6-deoxy-D-mannose reductase
MARIMVTGCSGFLAHYLVDLLHIRDTNTIFGVTEECDFKSEKYAVFNIDIRDQNGIHRVIKEVKPDLLFHLAALSNVGLSWKNQKMTYEVNFIGSSNILEAIHSYCPRSRVLLISSAELYRKGQAERIDEKTDVSIKNPYALSKYAMEMLGDLYSQSMKLDVVKIRSFNFTGPGQSKNFVCSDLAHQIVLIEKKKMKPEIRVGNLAAVRDFSDVRDIARYLIILGEKGQTGCMYNICSGQGYAIEDILNQLISLSQKEIKVKIDQSKFRPTDTPYLVGDCSLIREQFGCYPEFDIQQTLIDILDYWRNFYQ